MRLATARGDRCGLRDRHLLSITHEEHRVADPTDRSTWPARLCRSFAEAEAADDAQYAAMTPADRVAMVAVLSRSAYAFADQGGAHGRELARHVERIVRGRR